jgi:hypothetical protein
MHPRYRFLEHHHEVHRPGDEIAQLTIVGDDGVRYVRDLPCELLKQVDVEYVVVLG